MTEISGVEFVQEAAAQEQGEAMSLEQILAETAEQTPTQAETAQTEQGTETGEQSGAADQQPSSDQVYRTQAEVDAAFGARIQAERNKFMRDNKPLMDKGALLEQYTQGMTDQEISEALQTIAAARLAKANEIDEKTARAIVQNSYRPPTPPVRQQPVQPSGEQVMRQRIDVVGEYMQLIGDPGFTLDTLRTNQAALQDFANGMSPHDLYAKHFAPRPQRASAPPVEKRGSTVAGNGGGNGRYSSSELDRIMEYVANGGVVRTD